jgi:hypothetical protein
LGTKYLVVLCAGSTLPLAKQSLDEVPYKLSGAVAKLVGITFWSIGFFLDTIKSWFLTEGKFATVLIIPSSWGSELGGCLPASSIIFWRRCRGKRRLLQGEFRTHILYFVLCFALLYFYLHRFIKNSQKISSLYSCYFCWSVIVLLYHAFYQWLVSLKLNLFGKVGSL